MNHGWLLSRNVIVMLFIIFFISLTGKNVYARRYFLIERPKLGLEFSYEFEKDERTGSDIERKDTSMTFSGKLDIETRGWVYHPALVTYSLSLSPEWEQIYTKPDRGDKRTSKNFFLGYSAKFTFLQYKPYTLSVFASEHRTTFNSNFAARSKRKSNSYGAKLLLKYRILPTTLRYRHRKSTQSGFFSTDTERDNILLHMRHDKYLGDTDLNVSYTDSSQTTLGRTISIFQHRVNLRNISNLTRDESITLNSNLIYINTKSDFTKIVGYNVSEKLNWRHRKNLSTNYSFRYETSDFKETSRKSEGLGFGLSYLPYKNLSTLINARGSSSQFTGGKTTIYGAGLNVNYGKEIPWGRFNINTRHNYNINKRDITANFIQVIDESITLTTWAITLLENENADIGSIVITDTTGTILYLRDIDYRITEIDSFVRISRIPFGGINDDDTVLVNYRYLSNPAFDYSTFSQSYKINLKLWSAWRIHYSFSHSKQRFLSGIPPDRLTDGTIHTAGTELRWKWSLTKLKFRDRDTTNVPTTSWNASETVSIRPFKKGFFSLSGNYGETKLKDTGEIQKFYGLHSNIQWVITKRSRLQIEGFYDKISGTALKTVDTGFSSLLEWYYRIWRVSLRYRFSHEKDEISTETLRNHYFLFQLRRTLF